MRVIFVPYSRGGLSHLIPLVALQRQLDPAAVEAAFLLPADMAPWARELALNVLPIDHQGGLRSELKAYRSFPPDVVVDDCSLSTGPAAALAGVPRVTLQRTGTFPFQIPRNPGHRHSLRLNLLKLPHLAGLGLKPAESLTDLLADAAVKIVPGIPSIEVLPDQLREDRSYVFAGPLIVEDYLSGVSDTGCSGETRQRDLKDFGSLERFFKANRDREVVYFTYGLMAECPSQVLECMRYLLDRDTAVVSSVWFEGLGDRYPGLYYHASYLPMHFVCSRVRLAIHHCGSAAYHYPLLHEVPTITIGTQCYDRDDVAVRLDELGASRHLRSPLECERFVERFKAAVCEYDDAGVYSRRNAATGRLHREIEETAARFDLQSILDGLLSAV